jgi:hypothetical protein
MKPTTTSITLALSAALALATGAWAQTPEAAKPATKPAAKAKPAATKKPTCAQEAADIQQQRDGIKSSEEQHLKDKATIDQEKAAMASSLTALDRTDEKAVAAYNQRLADRKSSIEALNVRADAHNAKLEALQTKNADHVLRCPNAGKNPKGKK